MSNNNTPAIVTLNIAPSHWGAGLICDAEVIRTDDPAEGDPPRYVVIVSERADNPGMSITNGAERVADALVRHLGCLCRELVYIEHYPRDGADGEPVPTWDIVTFKGARGGTFTDADWRPATHDDFAELGIDDPRPYYVDASHVTLADTQGGGECMVFELYDNRPQSRHNDNSPRLLEWWCDRPGMHGEGAYRRAASRVSAIYRGRLDAVPSPVAPGDPVCIRFSFGGQGPFLVRGIVERIEGCAGDSLAQPLPVGNPFKCSVLRRELKLAAGGQFGETAEIGFAREQISPA
jgi:hypothetical protein